MVLPGCFVKIVDELHAGDELRNPHLPHLYCNPRNLIDKNDRMIVIAINDSRGYNDVLVLTSIGKIGWINQHSLEILLL